jgi:hypothetical protein
MEGTMAEVVVPEAWSPDAADQGPALGLPQPIENEVKEWFRGVIALVLLVVVALGLGVLMWARIADQIDTNDDASTLVQIFVAPLLTLLGTAVGYYFGTQQAD